MHYKLYTYLYQFFILFLGINFIVACDSMEDKHLPYLQKKEVLYPPKPLNLRALPAGEGKVKIWFHLTSLHDVKEVVVSYQEDDQTHQKTFDLSASSLPSFITQQLINASTQAGANKLQNLNLPNRQVVLDGLQERNYTFQVYTKNPQGDSSLTSDIPIRVLGQSVVGKLKKSIRTIVPPILFDKTNRCSFSLDPASDAMRNTTIAYTNRRGEKKQINVPQSQERVVLTDISLTHHTFRIRTFHSLVDEGIEFQISPQQKIVVAPEESDFFPSEWKEVTYSRYAGRYQSTGTYTGTRSLTTDWTASNPKFTKLLLMVDERTVVCDIANLNQLKMKIAINPDNSVVLSSVGGHIRSTTNPSTYDPNTHTLTLYYQFLETEMFTETLVLE